MTSPHLAAMAARAKAQASLADIRAQRLTLQSNSIRASGARAAGDSGGNQAPQPPRVGTGGPGISFPPAPPPPPRIGGTAWEWIKDVTAGALLIAYFGFSFEIARLGIAGMKALDHIHIAAWANGHIVHLLGFVQ